MERGYVKLWRKSADSGLMQNHKLWVFWTWCIMKASHKKRKQMVGMQMVELNPGDFIFGRKVASKELKISEQTIRTCVLNLKKLQNLTIKVTNKFSVISIVNWDSYQEQQPINNQQINQQLTNNQPTTNQQLTTNKNVSINNLNTKKENIPPDNTLFDNFWSLYQKPVNKKACLSKWNKIPIKTQGIILEIVPDYILSTPDKKYRKNPLTYLNGESWKDEIITESNSKEGNDRWNF